VADSPVSTGNQPFELLQRMQQQAAAAGYTLPQVSEGPERWSGLAFGVGDIRLVAELVDFTDIIEPGVLTPVPRTRPWVRGITNVRGSLCSVVDLAQFLGFSRINVDNEGKLLVINDPGLGCALLVNRIFGLRHFDPENEHKDAGVMERSVQPFVTHAFLRDDALWGVIDLDGLKSSEQFQDVEADT